MNELDEEYRRLLVENERLKKELQEGKARWQYFESRFVKCNTCTPDKKENCLMFTEGLCEGERCEELIDLEALIDKAIEKESEK